MDKISSSGRLNYYMELDFGSRAIKEIVFNAYHINQAEVKFANKWYDDYAEFSFIGFWAGIDGILV